MNSIDIIYNLYKYDSNISEMMTSVTKNNDTINTLNAELEELIHQSDQCQEEIDDHRKKMDSIQKDVKCKDTEIENINRKFLMIKTQKELDKFNAQLENLKNEKIALEDEILQHMLAVEELEEEKSSLQESITAKSSENEIRIQELNDENSNLDTEISKLKDLRKTFSEGIPEQLIKHYDDKRKKLKPPVSVVDKETCKGCHLKIPANVMVDAKDRNSLKSCPNCGRLIYIPPR